MMTRSPSSTNSSSRHPALTARFLLVLGITFHFHTAPGEGEQILPDITPSPVAANQYAALLENPPFTRTLDFSESIQLTGLAVIDGKQVATVRNRKDKKSYVISTTPNEDGWKMMEVEKNADLEKVSATIAVTGGELVTLHFDESQLKPGDGKSPNGLKAPQGPDNRSRPTDEEKRKFGEWVRGRMSKMSDEQKKRVGKIMQEKMKANPKLSDRQKGEVFVKILDHVESGK